MKVGNVSFGSTYAIKYDYTLFKAYGYASTNSDVRNFVDVYNRHAKGKDEISAINPEEKTYFIKMPDSKDKKFENLLKAFYVKSKVRKVNEHKMEGAVITSIGATKDEIALISDKISDYEHSKQLENEINLP